MFFDGDGDPDGQPVAHEGEEVCEDLAQVVAAGEGADGVDDDADGVPDKAGDFLSRGAEDLEVDAGGVGGWDGVCNDAEGDDDGEEGAEFAEREG